MHITLYNNSSDRRTLNKSISAVAEFENAKTVENFNISTPQFIISYDVSLLTSVNYCYCAETNRYYHITDITVLTGGRVQLNCICDVLMSYKNDINTLTALCVRNETINNQRIVDKNFPTTGDTNIKAIQFNNSSLINPNSDAECFVLIVSGSKE